MNSSPPSRNFRPNSLKKRIPRRKSLDNLYIILCFIARKLRDGSPDEVPQEARITSPFGDSQKSYRAELFSDRLVRCFQIIPSG